MQMPEWMERFTAVAKQDPRKTGALSVLSLVLIVMVIRAAVTGDNQPARAAAAPITAPQTSVGGASKSSSNAIGADVDGAVDRSDAQARRVGRANNSTQRL